MVELKIGDRVATYLAIEQDQRRFVGVIVSICGEAFEIQADRTTSVSCLENYWVHRKQVRKLVKKRRRQFWLRVCEKHVDLIFNAFPSGLDACRMCEIIKVREVK